MGFNLFLSPFGKVADIRLVSSFKYYTQSQSKRPIKP